MITAVAVLTAAEADLLAEAETTIERGIKTFIEVGEALTQVRDNRLYRADFPTFEDYCRTRWGFSRQRALQLIDASEVATTIVVNGLPAPANEGQARELSPLLESPDEMRAAFTEAIARSDGRPTAAVIREVVRERMDPASPLAQVAERELDRVERRQPAGPQPRFTPERVAEIEDFVRPAVQFGRLVDACRFFLEQLADVDIDAAARGFTAEKSQPISEAVARLASLRRALEVTA